VSQDTNLNTLKEREIEELESKFEDVRNKIIFNSVLEFAHFKGNWKKRKVLKDLQEKLRIAKINEKVPMNSIPVSCKYLRDTPEIHKKEDNVETKSENGTVCLPYSIETELDLTTVSSKVQHDGNGKEIDLLDEQMLKSSEYGSSSEIQLPIMCVSNPSISNWMSDYEYYDENEDGFENLRPWELHYGTPDTSVPISDVPCGGCGALLHCQVSFCCLLSAVYSSYMCRQSVKFSVDFPPGKLPVLHPGISGNCTEIMKLFIFILSLFNACNCVYFRFIFHVSLS
jgi:hypothetical protein